MKTFQPTLGLSKTNEELVQHSKISSNQGLVIVVHYLSIFDNHATHVKNNSLTYLKSDIWKRVYLYFNALIIYHFFINFSLYSLEQIKHNCISVLCTWYKYSHIARVQCWCSAVFVLSDCKLVVERHLRQLSTGGHCFARLEPTLHRC